jgi:hypothetical protein
MLYTCMPPRSPSVPRNSRLSPAHAPGMYADSALFRLPATRLHINLFGLVLKSNNDCMVRARTAPTTSRPTPTRIRRGPFVSRALEASTSNCARACTTPHGLLPPDNRAQHTNATCTDLTPFDGNIRPETLTPADDRRPTAAIATTILHLALYPHRTDRTVNNAL